jgi:DNA repair exonuclease SbcCD nuclease subunit
MAIRLLHISDLHLDCGFKSKDKHISNLLKGAQRQAFSHAVEAAIQKKCHIVALTGDVFHDDQMTFRTEDILFEGFSKLLSAGIVVVYITGNHDFMGLQRSLLTLVEHPNFVLFNKPEPIKVIRQIEEHRVALIGCGHQTSNCRQNVAKDFPVVQPDEMSIGFYHGMVQGSVMQEDEEEPYMACTLQDLVSKKYHYWALGHIHKRQILSDGIAYAGSLQGVRRSETQKKGGWLVTIAPSKTELHFLPFSSLEFRNLHLNIDSSSHAPSLYNQLKQHLIQAIEDDSRYIFNVTLMGLTSEYDKMSHESFCDEFLEDFQNEKILALKLDFSGVIPSNCETLIKSPYLSIAINALDNLLNASDFSLRLKPLENQGIDVYGFVEQHKETLKNQLMYLFKEDK